MNNSVEDIHLLLYYFVLSALVTKGWSTLSSTLRFLRKKKEKKTFQVFYRCADKIFVGILCLFIGIYERCKSQFIEQKVKCTRHLLHLIQKVFYILVKKQNTHRWRNLHVDISTWPVIGHLNKKYDVHIIERFEFSIEYCR